MEKKGIKSKIKNIIIELIILFLKVTNNFFKIFQKENDFIQVLHDRLEKKQYKSIIINKKKINFFCPSEKTLYRVNTYFEKEPEILNWIDNFKSVNNKLIFWDIGANIGLYSLYAAIKFDKIEVVSFEPSASNIRALSRNISINSYSDKIALIPLALSDEEKALSNFEESKFIEGGSNNQFDNRINQSGKIINISDIENKYRILGTSIDYLLENNILEVPNYIKIDVDGVESKILNGAEKLLKNPDLKEVFIEMNPYFKENFSKIEDIFKENGFKKIIETNFKILRDKNYKIKELDSLNTVYQRI